MLSMPRARRGDPATSHQAAARSHQFSGSHAAKILSAIKHMPGQTASYYSQMTGLTVVQIDRRLPEMERKGLIRTTGAVYNGFRAWEAV
jgi:DNA-binding MarR family transcriptional regulator